MSQQFNINETSINGLISIQRKPVGDQRGYLERLYCSDFFDQFTNKQNIKQINHTLTQKKGTLRGMHFQYPPYSEIKIVSCIQGSVFDVAIDLRKNSPTFLQWYGEILEAGNYTSLLIPEGFAHGFQTLTKNCEMLYFHTKSYMPSAEGAINALDPMIAITWPLDITEISDRDSNHVFLDSRFEGIII